MKSNLAPHPENGGSCCSGDCMLHAFISVIVGGWLLQVRSPIKPFERWASDNDYPFQCMQRDNIRQRYKIKGGCWSDCCTALCCTPCELAQESKELELEEKTWNQRKRPGIIESLHNYMWAFNYHLLGTFSKVEPELYFRYIFMTIKLSILELLSEVEF